MHELKSLEASGSDLPRFHGCDVVRRVQSGPIADVYHAVQQPLGRPCLIKSLSSSILPSSPFAATLEREARLLSQMDHPNVVRLYDFIREAERLWLVLEYVDGVPLSQLIGTRTRPSIAACTAIALELARALEHAHAHGIVHRQVQPDNILIARAGSLKLINFAVAVANHSPSAHETLDGPSSFVEPSYMSPEQVLGEVTDPRSDLFSLGVVLYEMLARRRPFAADEDKSASQQIRHEPVTPLSRLVPQTAGTLERIAHRCLQKLPSDRFASASELIVALQNALKQFSDRSSEALIHEALFDAGLSDRTPPASKPSSRRLGARRKPLWPILRGQLFGFGLIVVGGGLIQWFSSEQDAAPARRNQRLELVPPQTAYLRIVADPWARVSINGQYVDTTPFAWAIPLRAGTHYVRLEHPSAPTERRTVKLLAGESVLLDVQMKVPRPAPPAPVAKTPPKETTGDRRDAKPSP